MGLYILGAIILLPLLEIAVFIAVGQAIGILPTVLLTVFTAVTGTLMLRQQGLSLVMRMQAELGEGRAPEAEIMHGALIVMASILLLLPGFVTDGIGLFLFVPPIREALIRFILSRSNVTIINGGNQRNSDPVVDLDEADWSTKEAPNTEETGPKPGQERISPWSAPDGGPKN